MLLKSHYFWTSVTADLVEALSLQEERKIIRKESVGPSYISWWGTDNEIRMLGRIVVTPVPMPSKVGHAYTIHSRFLSTSANKPMINQ